MNRVGRRAWFAFGFIVLLSGCRGGGGDANGGLPSGSVGLVVISGVITFDLVPATAAAGLDFSAVTAAPARGVTVNAVRDGAVLAETVTDSSGRYVLEVPAHTSGITLQARAELLRDAGATWDFRVLDNTQGNALYALTSSEIETTYEPVTRNLHAASGWDGAAYTAPRSAAPFAILDAIYDGAEFLRGVAPDLALPPLDVYWSPNNVPTMASNGSVDLTTGHIGTTFFTPADGFRIYLLGSAESDADEYDRHVIVHEWAHLLEYVTGRWDAIGGPHARFEHLDMRSAFSEGFANAFAAMALDDPLYVDVLTGLGNVFAFDVEGPYNSVFPENLAPGWFSEESVHEILYDLYDATPDGVDDLEFGFAPLFEALQDARSGVPLMSVFSFGDALRARQPGFAPQIDALFAAQSIGPFTDGYGTGEQNSGFAPDGADVLASDILPIYKPADIGVPVTVCSTDAYHSPSLTGGVNKLGVRAFVRFTTPTAGVYRVTATTTLLPEGADQADPDLRLHSGGVLYESTTVPDPQMCTAATPAGCTETFERSLGAGDFVLEVYEWTNTQHQGAIGRTCFDVQVTAQ